MKFMISRTSMYGEKPCDKAFRDKYIRIDERTTDAPEKIPVANGKSEWWYEKGSNHRVENGHIKRDFEDEAWFINIESLDNLSDLIEDYGRVIIQPAYTNNDILEMEIYDSYRE